jgi:hypothetical protein
LITPVPEQYGHGSVITRSRLCFTRLRVMMMRPKSETCSAFDGDRSFFSSSSTVWKTFCRFFFSSMSMKSRTIMPPKSRRRTWRTISFTASRFVLTIVSSSRPDDFLPT